MDLSARALLDALACRTAGCSCHAAERRGHGLTHCPAHDDRNPSLSVDERDGRVVFKCHAGCSQQEVVAALRAHGHWPRREGQRLDGSKRPPFSQHWEKGPGDEGGSTTRYPIRDLAGWIVAVHVRSGVMAPKGRVASTSSGSSPTARPVSAASGRPTSRSTASISSGSSTRRSSWSKGRRRATP